MAYICCVDGQQEGGTRKQWKTALLSLHPSNWSAHSYAADGRDQLYDGSREGIFLGDPRKGDLDTHWVRTPCELIPTSSSATMQKQYELILWQALRQGVLRAYIAAAAREI